GSAAKVHRGTFVRERTRDRAPDRPARAVHDRNLVSKHAVPTVGGRQTHRKLIACRPASRTTPGWRGRSPPSPPHAPAPPPPRHRERAGPVGLKALDDVVVGLRGDAHPAPDTCNGLMVMARRRPRRRVHDPGELRARLDRDLVFELAVLHTGPAVRFDTGLAD